MLGKQLCQNLACIGTPLVSSHESKNFFFPVSQNSKTPLSLNGNGKVPQQRQTKESLGLDLIEQKRRGQFNI